MQFKIFLFASLASVTVAQTSTACAAQNILDSCVATIQGLLNSCSVSDYTCKCTQYTNMINSCYAACPNDPNVGTVQSLKQQNCADMSAYGTTTVLGTNTATSAAAASTTSSTHASTTVQSGFASSTSSGTSSSASATSTSSSHSGAQAVNAAGGLVVLVAAGVAALL